MQSSSVADSQLLLSTSRSFKTSIDGDASRAPLQTTVVVLSSLTCCRQLPPPE